MHSAELHNLYSTNATVVVKSRRIRLGVAQMGGGQKCTQGSGGDT